MEHRGFCLLDVWLATYLAALLGLTFAFVSLSRADSWLRYPGTIALFAVAGSLSVTELAAPRVSVPPVAAGSRRPIIYVAALIIGVVLDWSISPGGPAPRTFKLGIFILFGLPLFAWSLLHIWRVHRPRAALAACTTAVLFVLYLTAIFIPNAA